jgi:citrate lyase beta subunit
MIPRPLRSALYVPGSNARALEKAAALPVDAVLVDLEDAVAPDAKPAAREAALAAPVPRGLRVLRVNGAGTPWHEDDLAAAARLDPDAVLLPKAGSGRDVAEVARRTGLPVWAMVETPAGVLAAAGIAEAVAATGGIGVLVMGTNDLAKELGARHAPDRAPMAASLGLCVLAARAHGIGCLDGVFNAFRDEDGLRAECAQGRAMGFDGKTLIHPAQIAAANEAFAPGAEEVETARREIEAFEAAQAEGRGVAVLDGRLIEALHVETARATLARADAIAEGEAA